MTSKTDLQHGFAAAYEEGGFGEQSPFGDVHTFAYVGTDRWDNDGDTALGIWFLQEPIDIATVGSQNIFVNADTGLALAHSDGDVLIEALFTGSGQPGTIEASEWTGGSLTNLNLGSLPTNTVIAATNSAPINVPWPFIEDDGATTPQTGEFFEVGVDLNQLFGLTQDQLPEFESFIITSQVSSGSNSVLNDFIIGEITIAADVTVTKTAVNPVVNVGDQAGFTVTVSNAGTIELDNVTLNDPLPAGVDWEIDLGNSDPGFQITGAVNSETLTFAAETDLAFNQSLSVRIVGTTTAAGLLENTATVAAVNENLDFTDNNEATATISVDAGNVAPVAEPDAYTTPEDTPLTVAAPGVLANDTDADGDPLTASLTSNVSNGSLTLNSNGSFSYTPNANVSGSDSFTYVANDDTTNSNLATVTITVNAVDDPPVAADDAYVTDEDVPLNIAAPGVLANDTDIDSTTLTAVLDTEPSNGMLTLNSDGSFDYEPDPNFSGSDSFTYFANDGTSNSNPATVTITVIEINDPPVAEDDQYATDEDTAFTSPVSLLDNDFDDDGILMIVSSPTLSASGAVVSVDHNTGQFTYDPTTSSVLQSLPAGSQGTDVFTYAVSDGVATDTATVTITVDGVNDAPIAVNDIIFISPSVGTGTLDVLANDGDIDTGDTLTIDSVTTSNPFGSAVITGNQLAIDFDSLGDEGLTTFEYTISDSSGATDTATVTVAVSDSPCILFPNGHLLCIGTPVADRMIAEPSFEGIIVRYNSLKFGPFSPVTSIEFLGLGGNDQLITRADLPVTFDGGQGNDYLTGSPTDDLMIGDAGNDRILAGEGNNVIYGDHPSQPLAIGNDDLQGRSGEDIILGGPGNDRIQGQAGNDILSGDTGNDEIFGGLGDDFSFDGGFGGRDVIRDESGDDVILGGPGIDRLTGGLDSDLIIGGTGGEEWIRGDAGDDALINGSSSLESQFDQALEDLAAGDDTLFNLLILPGLTDWRTSRTINFGALSDDGESDLIDGGTGSDRIDAEIGIDIDDFNPDEGDTRI